VLGDGRNSTCVTQIDDVVAQLGSQLAVVSQRFPSPGTRIQEPRWTS